MFQGSGLWMAQHFPCILLLRLTGVTRICSQPTGGSPAAPAVQTALRVKDWPPNRAYTDVGTVICNLITQGHKFKDDLGYIVRLCFRREEKRFQSRKEIMDEQIATFSPLQRKAMKAACDTWASRTVMCFWEYLGLSESWMFGQRKSWLCRSGELTVGQVHIAQGPLLPHHHHTHMLSQRWSWQTYLGSIAVNLNLSPTPAVL